ncbi:MAG TPA: 30S ribosomal protein S5 [Candidatus Staskawiczbacteria bacterium]|nr:30S ribosomal protein S5 [Candidatus Staskawiczbacteria bacterium]
MAEEIKQKDTSAEPAKEGGFQRRPRRPGFGRAGVGRAAARDEFESKLLDLARVTRVTGGGKRLRFRAVVIAGNKKGKVGIGIDKGRDVSQAIEKATRMAKKNLIEVVIVNETIPHEVQAKSGPARLLLKPQKKGRGLVAGGAVRTICELAGIKNISSKILSGSKNKLNNARVTMEAFKKLKEKK